MNNHPQQKQKQKQKNPRSRSARPKKSRHIFQAFTETEIKARIASIPQIKYPEELPISAERTKIAKAIRENQVVILAGETGSGKTTQLPKICLEIGRGINGLIGHTQPRRIAARSVAERIANELNIPLGSIIGYQVRFTEIVSRDTLIKLMTDGILLAEIQSDPTLQKYDTIIIDEAHERSLNIDFLLGYLAQLLPQRPDLKLIITSATIDSARFATHFEKYALISEEHSHSHVRAKLSEIPQTPALTPPSPQTSSSALASTPTSTPTTNSRHIQPKVPVIEVSGRTYPVEIRYRPLDGSCKQNSFDTQNSDNDDEESYLDADPQDQISGILQAAAELINEGPGDILIFLSGEGEIHATQKAFQDSLGARYISPGENSKIPGAIEVLPLFARLSAREQHRIFTPHRHRRIILATNIAETSLTVPSIRYVIDPGTARISRYSNKTKVQRLPIEAISQASANQRAGRCGRVADGIAIRLYSAEDFAARPKFTEPEIQRTSLASVILQMAALNLGEVANFPFIDPPDLRAVRAGTQLLEEIGALAVTSRTPYLTKIGRKLARLPIDPRLGRMLLAANENGCAVEVLVLVAAMSVQDVRERPLEFKAQADQLHARFTDPTSDFLAYLNIWRYLRTQQRELSGSAFRKLCRAEYLHWLRFREWEDVVTQLRQLAKPLGIKLKQITIPSDSQLQETAIAFAEEGKDSTQNRDIVAAVKNIGNSVDVPAADAIHQSLLTGMLSNLGNWDERKHDYAGARGTHFVIWPGSGLYKRTPSWVMAAELVETSRLFARSVARINSDWIEKIAQHLVKYQYSEPYWSTRNGAAMVHEKVTLYGMTIVSDRPALLSKIGSSEAKELARELFIRHGLVENQWRAHYQFIKHNQRQIAKAQEVETRLRQYGLVADENKQFQFFDARLPENIISGAHFASWWKKAQHKTPTLLNFTQDFLLGSAKYDVADFPQKWRQGDIELPITYGFKPGTHADGLTIEVPITLLPQLRDEGFDWLVPGMIPELVQATIRALPKRIRRHLVPAPDVAQEILAELATQKIANSQNKSDHTTSEVKVLKDPFAHPQSFTETFSSIVKKLKNIEITPETWAEVVLPKHLEINFIVRSERGAVLDEGPSLSELQRNLAPQTTHAIESVVKSAVAQALATVKTEILASTITEKNTKISKNTNINSEKTETENLACLSAHTDILHGWPKLHTESLPELVETRDKYGAIVRGYPAFVEVPSDSNTNSQEKTQVTLRVLADPATQMRDHQQGIIRLLMNEIALPEGRITSRWSPEESLLLASSPYPNTGALVAEIQLTAVRNIGMKWAKSHKIPLGRIRSEAEYIDLRKYVKPRIEDEIYRISQISARIFSAWSEVNNAIRMPSAKSIAMINTVEDVKQQINQLIYDGFIFATPDSSLIDIIRYLNAVKYRIEKAPANLLSDEENSEIISEMEELLAQEITAFEAEKYDPKRAAVLLQVKWMIQELRVSLFAQILGTKMKISPQRIQKAFNS